MTIRLAKTSSGRVSVRGAADLREGGTIQRRFKAAARRKSAIKRLAHCKKRKRKIVCR